MGLESYREKRDFRRTPEPKGRKARKKGQGFVVQKHDARRLHYDFRLEMEGVLRSWAVTRGPSLVPGDKRLAVHVEDHPLDYGDFEGVIPEGSYGAGTVMLWDRGTWEPIGDPLQGYAKGHIRFDLGGEKLKGRWDLVRLQKKTERERENWLLIKVKDTDARGKDDPDILEEQPLSVKTGRDMDGIAGGAKVTATAAKAGRPKAEKAKTAKADTPFKGAKKEELPDFLPPMLATPKAAAPRGAGWLHEIKFDGYRIQARVEGGKCRLLTRAGLDWTDRFGPDLPKALAALPVKQALFDGEVVVEGAGGASDFAALQADLGAGRADRFIYYAFDLLHLDGHWLRRLPLFRRKEMLETLLADAADPIRYAAHFDESGEMVLTHACRLSLEGILSKRRDSPWEEGRSRDWIKSKCIERQEFVIAGFTPSSVTPDAIGSLVLGVYEGKDLVHVGRVGTGFPVSVAADLYRRLEPLTTPDSPFAKPLKGAQAKDVHHVRPELVAEVEFRSWTAGHILRHAVFRGLREDKPAADIVAEAPTTPAKAPAVAKSTVKITHPDRVYWPDAGITKEGLCDHYARVWRQIAPFIVNRPLALLRAPTGITGQVFFQKNAWKGQQAAIRRFKDKGAELVGIDSFDGLIGLVQGAALEIHPWGAQAGELDRPDIITMDIDPDESVAWERVTEAAFELRDRLEAAGLNAFVKTSGGKGLHVVAPLLPHAGWAEVKAFTRAMAQEMAMDSPARYVATVSKAKRRGKILIDYLRNQRGATAVAPWSPRARAGAPVSTPIAWEECGPAIGPAHFTLANIETRLNALESDPWAGFHAAAEPMRKRG